MQKEEEREIGCTKKRQFSIRKGKWARINVCMAEREIKQILTWGKMSRVMKMVDEQGNEEGR